MAGVKKGARRVVSQPKLTKNAVAGILGTVMQQSKANQLAGLSNTSSSPTLKPVIKETVDQIRERLRDTPGYRLDDSAAFYKGKSEQKKVCTSDQIRARARLDGILGHDAPQQVNISQRTEIFQANMTINALISSTGLTPQQLLQSVNDSVPSRCTVGSSRDASV